MEHHLCLLFKAAGPVAQHGASSIEALLELDNIVRVAFY
jgi:hypothetical protein